MAYEPQAEYKPQGDWGGIVQYGNDKHLVVMFYMRSEPNPLKSEQAGVRYCDSIPYVRIHHPGERDQVIDRPVREDDKMRFAARWRDFEANREQTADGIPIDMLFPTYPHIADNLRSHGVHTIEQCANLSAHGLDSIGMGAQEYKNRAKDYIEAAGEGAGYHKLQGQLEGMKAENARLKADIATLSAQFGAVMQQIKQGVPVPGAMVPQNGIPGIASARNAPQPLPNEPHAPLERRNDMMAEIPAAGKIVKKSWGKKAEAEGAE